MARWRDPALALALATAGLAEVFAHGTYNHVSSWPGPVAVNAVYVPALCAPFLWRRSRPLAAFTVVAALICLGTVVLGSAEATTEFVLILAAIYSVAAYSRHALVAAVLATVTIVVHDSRDPTVHGISDTLWALGFAAVAWLVGMAVHGRQRTIVELQSHAEEVALRHAAEVAAATAAERTAIARELHDVIAHTVSIVVVQAQAGRRALPEHPAVAAQVLDTIETTGRQAIHELRRLLTVLSDGQPADVAPAPSLRQLGTLLDGLRHAGLDLTCAIDDELPLLEPTVDVTAYRVIQESLTNMLRHAQGRRGHLTVRAASGWLEIIAENPAAATSTPSPGTGRGLIGMRERLGLVGGRLDQAGLVDGRYVVHASIPLQEQTTDSHPAGLESMAHS